MMKNLVMIFIVAFSANLVFGQKDTVKFSKYIGTFYIGSYDKEFVRSNDVTLRLGGDASIPLFEKFNLNAWAGYETGNGTAFGLLCLKRKSPVLDFGVGYMGRPITVMMRPKPISADGHFEPPALGAIPAGETGMCVGRKLWAGGPEAVVGIFYLAPDQSGEFDFSLKQNFGQIELATAGFVSSVRKGISGRIKVGDASLTAFTESDSVSTAFLCWKMVYLNANYNRSSDSFDQLELGVFKTFDMPYGAKVLLGAGYQQHSKGVNFYVQIFFD